MTNSPPAKVKLDENECARVMACGIDWLTLAIDVRWESKETFDRLAKLKDSAIADEADQPAQLDMDTGSSAWQFNVKPHGAGGYEWLLVSAELSMKIGNWLEPKQRPSVMVNVRSETLWTHGPAAALVRVVELLKVLGGEVVTIKPSRVDLCLDLLLPEHEWTPNLIDSFVTRARDISPHFQYRELSGFSIGRGKISARLYDKPREIATKSHKDWMYDVWGISAVAEDHRIIRIEYQLRREVLIELSCRTWDQLCKHLGMLWKYCATCWLHLVDDRSRHHTQQIVLPWWDVVASGFTGARDAEPGVREKTCKAHLRQLASQTIGLLGSIVALLRPESRCDFGIVLNMRSSIHLAVNEAIKLTDLNDREFTRRVERKQARNRHPGKTSKKTVGHRGQS